MKKKGRGIVCISLKKTIYNYLRFKASNLLAKASKSFGSSLGFGAAGAGERLVFDGMLDGISGKSMVGSEEVTVGGVAFEDTAGSDGC